MRLSTIRPNASLNDRRDRSNGSSASFPAFTIIELLFVLIVATILLSFAIPRIRLLTKERGIRETARIVASKFANASAEARLKGTAGILIRRNRNFEDQGIWFASTEIGTLSSVPNFVGDQRFEKGIEPSLGAWKRSPDEVQIPIPIEYEEDSPVQPGDWISFNHTPPQYQILTVEKGRSVDNGRVAVLVLKLDVILGWPKLPFKLEDAPYTVHRQPQLKRSSLQELPNRYLIDLRFSGFTSGETTFRRTVVAGDRVFQNYDIVFLFNQFGNIEKVYYHEVDRNNLRTGAVSSRRVKEAVHFLIAESSNSPNQSPLTDPLSLWVNVNAASGATSVGYINAQSDDELILINGSHVRDARENARFEANH